MKFQFLKKTGAPTHDLMGRPIKEGDYVRFDGHLAEKAMKSPDYRQVDEAEGPPDTKDELGRDSRTMPPKQALDDEEQRTLAENYKSEDPKANFESAYSPIRVPTTGENVTANQPDEDLNEEAQSAREGELTPARSRVDLSADAKDTSEDETKSRSKSKSTEPAPKSSSKTRKSADPDGDTKKARKGTK